MSHSVFVRIRQYIDFVEKNLFIVTIAKKYKTWYNLNNTVCKLFFTQFCFTQVYKWMIIYNQ